MTNEAQGIVAAALAKADTRAAATPRVDYKALNRMVKRQRGALTRAINSGDPDKVVIACRNAVHEWDRPGAMWPDDWSRWQCALDDALPFHQQISLEDLR